MPIESTCERCGKRLRVADKHAGQVAKCPHCQALYTVPFSAAALGAGNATDSPLDSHDRWQLRLPDGRVFGPVSRSVLDHWVAEGRILGSSQILREGAGQWLWASQVYPQLAATRASHQN